MVAATAERGRSVTDRQHDEAGVMHLTICFLSDGSLAVHVDGQDREALAVRLGAFVYLLNQRPELIRHVAGGCVHVQGPRDGVVIQ
jgi:CO dehydrogenase/acetyl-CoA synthase epsilon subunit